MSIATIERALQVRLTEVWPHLPTAWENEPFSYPSTPWQEGCLLPAAPQEPTIGTSHLIYESGILQVKLFYPPDQGTSPARERGDIIKSFFPRGLTLTQQSINVFIERLPVIHPAMEDVRGGVEWYVIPISIYYYSYIRS